MKINQQENFKFELKEVSFAELKAIRDACQEYAKQGSTRALAVYREIKNFIENQSV